MYKWFRKGRVKLLIYLEKNEFALGFRIFKGWELDWRISFHLTFLSFVFSFGGYDSSIQRLKSKWSEENV